MNIKRKRILLVNGHPGESSLSKALLDRYRIAAEQAGFPTRRVEIHDLNFDIDFGQSSYRNSKQLEPDLNTFLADLEWSQHVVLASPLWWGGLPAKLKGLFDRTLLPGRSFDPKNPGFMGSPEPLLAGRSARLMLTSDTARWAMRVFYGDALIKQMRKQVFGFVGIKPTKLSYFAPANEVSEPAIHKWLKVADKLGSQGE